MARNGLRVASKFNKMLAFIDILDAIEAWMDRRATMRWLDLNGWHAVCNTGGVSGGPLGTQHGCGPQLISRADRTTDESRPVPWFRTFDNSWNVVYASKYAPRPCPGAFCGFGDHTVNSWWDKPGTPGTANPGVKVGFQAPGDAPEVFPEDPLNVPSNPRPLPWEVIPHIEPNPDAPEPIRRQVGPEPTRNPYPEWMPSRDPFRYPVSPGPDIVVNPAKESKPNIPPWWKPAPSPTPSEKPGVEPTPTGVEELAPGWAIRAKPSHKYKPPGRKTKETKQKVNRTVMAAYQKLAKRFGQITEYSDALKCMYGALPEKVRNAEQRKRHGKKPSLVNMSKIVYKNADKISACHAAACLAAENLQDYVIGKGAKKHAEVRKKYGIRGGYQSRLAKRPGVNVKDDTPSFAEFVCGKN